MKTPFNSNMSRHTCIFIFALSFSSITLAQEDNTVQVDSTLQEDIKKQKIEKKAKSSFKVSAGLGLNTLNLDSEDNIVSNSTEGFNLGFSYKRGRFFYYEVGARYNYRAFSVSGVSDESNSTAESNFSVSTLDLPITGGINITSFADRLIGLRVFVSAIPSFLVSQDIDELPLEKDDINNFMLYGQGGIGIDITVFFIEIGYNYGFSNLINDIDSESITSNPGQAYLNIGFRF